MNQALKAVAQIADIDLRQAAQTTRKDPLFNEEIHIEAELINLEEAITTYHLASDTLKDYPKIRHHMLRERRVILKHCIGLIVRMKQGWRVPRGHNTETLEFAFKKLVQLVITDMQRAGYRLDEKTLETLKPFMNYRQRYAYRTWTYNPIDAARLGFRKFVSVRQFS